MSAIFSAASLMAQAKSGSDDDATKAFTNFCTTSIEAVRRQYEAARYEVQTETLYKGGKRQITHTFVWGGNGLMLSRTFVPANESDLQTDSFLDGAFLPEAGARIMGIVNDRYHAMIGFADGKPILRTVESTSIQNLRGDASACYACPVPGIRFAFEDLCTANDASVLACENLVVASRPVVRARIQFSAEKYAKFGPIVMESDFDPESGVCLRSDVTLGNSGSHPVFEMEYEPSGNTIPTLRRVTMTEPSTSTVMKWTFRNWDFGTTPPMDQCYLAFYGLPEPPDSDGSKQFSIPGWLWTLLAGLALLGTSVWLRRRRASSI